MHFSPKSFAKDHLARSVDGRPLGRLILRNDSDVGGDLKVVLFQIPKAMNLFLAGLKIWVDDYEYELPKVLSNLRIGDRKDSIILSNFVMKRVENGEG